MYIDLQPDTRTRRDRKALARKLHRDLVRTGYSNPEMAAWDVARGVVRTMRRLSQHWYRHSLGFMSQEDSLAARLYIRHRYRRVLQRLDTIEQPDLSLPIGVIESEHMVIIRRGKNRGKGPEHHVFAPVTDSHVDKTLGPVVNAAPPVVMLGTYDNSIGAFTIQKVEHLEGGGIHVTHEKPDGTVYQAGELFFPTITVGSDVPPAPSTVLLGEIDKTTRLPDGTTYRGEPNVLVPPVDTVKDPNVLPPGLPYPTPQKLIHPAAAKAVEAQESRVGKIKVNGKYTRVVQRVESSGIVNLYRVNDDGSKEPLTGIIG